MSDIDLDLGNIIAATLLSIFDGKSTITNYRLCYK